jgi:hypothetical protein
MPACEERKLGRCKRRRGNERTLNDKDEQGQHDFYYSPYAS